MTEAAIWPAGKSARRVCANSADLLEQFRTQQQFGVQLGGRSLPEISFGPVRSSSAHVLASRCAAAHSSTAAHALRLPYPSRSRAPVRLAARRLAGAAHRYNDRRQQPVERSAWKRKRQLQVSGIAALSCSRASSTAPVAFSQQRGCTDSTPPHPPRPWPHPADHAGGV